VPILAILFGPLEAVAVAAVSALLGNIIMWPDAIKKVHWPEAIPVSIGIAVAIPIGLIFLTTADPGVIRTGMGVFILIAAGLLISGWLYKGGRNKLTSILAGLCTGGIMGSFGMPAGPIMVIYYMSAPVEPQVQRANIVISVGVVLVFMMCGLYFNGAYHETTIARAIVIAPIFMAGAWIGSYLFQIAPVSWFKKITYAILIVTGISILLI
jgi:uncharacterized membrane protein YfcA